MATCMYFPTESSGIGSIRILDPVRVSIRPFFLFIDVSVIGLSETGYHTIVKICRQSGEFTGVDFSRVKASVMARLIPMNYVHL